MEPTEQARPVKPACKPPRSLTVLEPATPDTEGWFALRITVGKQTETYAIQEIASAIGGRAFTVEKLGPDLETVESYHVLLAGPDGTCDCKGGSYHGRCKHRLGLEALDALGKLPIRQKHVACNRCQRLTDAPGLCPECREEDDYHSARNHAAEMEAAGLDPWAECPFADDRYIPTDPDF